MPRRKDMVIFREWNALVVFTKYDPGRSMDARRDQEIAMAIGTAAPTLLLSATVDRPARILVACETLTFARAANVLAHLDVFVYMAMLESRVLVRLIERAELSDEVLALVPENRAIDEGNGYVAYGLSERGRPAFEDEAQASSADDFMPALFDELWAGSEVLIPSALLVAASRYYKGCLSPAASEFYSRVQALCLSSLCLDVPCAHVSLEDLQFGAADDRSLTGWIDAGVEAYLARVAIGHPYAPKGRRKPRAKSALPEGSPLAGMSEVEARQWADAHGPKALAEALGVSEAVAMRRMASGRVL